MSESGIEPVHAGNTSVFAEVDMGARRIRDLLLILVLLALGCSERRPLYPIEDGLPMILHDPFEDQEAEEFALELSASLIAPEPLYNRLHRDLAAIRTTWGDSLPIVMQRTFNFRYVPGEVVIFLHDEINVQEWLARATALDEIRRQYAFDSLSISENRITLNSRYRINTTFLLRRFERLPGVCWAQTTLRSIQPIGAYLSGDTIEYGYYIPGICWGWGCFPSYHYWFRSDSIQVEYLGEMNLNRGDSVPDQFRGLWSRWRTRPSNDQLDSITFRDETPPARATDLKFVGDQVGRAGSVTFTATGDDGIEGAAYSSTVCLSTQSITFENFNTVGYHYVKLNPGYSGDQHTLNFTNLVGNATNYFAVRFIDCNQNLSPVSNIAVSRNIWLNGWTHFNSANSSMPDDHVTAMLRDSRGRMWIATYNGLVCKEGERWEVFQTSNSGIPYNLITSLAEGPDGSIWVGTPQGLGRFDGVGWETFTRLNSAIPKQEISCVNVSDDGTVWLGYGQYGIVKYVDDTWTVLTPGDSPLRGSTIHSIYSDSKGNVWIGTNLGVNRVNGEEWTHYDPSNSGLGGLSGSAFIDDADGTIWCASSTGAVSWFDGTNWQNHRISGWVANSLSRATGGPLWIGARGGLWKHDGDDWLGLSGATTGLPSNNCTAVFAEDTETLWIGSSDNGLCRWDLRVAKMNDALAVLHHGD
jgi:hypothetical protein